MSGAWVHPAATPAVLAAAEAVAAHRADPGYPATVEAMLYAALSHYEEEGYSTPWADLFDDPQAKTIAADLEALNLANIGAEMNRRQT